MKNRNILLGIVIIAISVGGVLIYNLIPQFETTEFDPDVIEDISKGITTTSTTTETNNNNDNEEPEETNNGVIEEVIEIILHYF